MCPKSHQARPPPCPLLQPGPPWAPLAPPQHCGCSQEPRCLGACLGAGAGVGDHRAGGSSTFPGRRGPLREALGRSALPHVRSLPAAAVDAVRAPRERGRWGCCTGGAPGPSGPSARAGVRVPGTRRAPLPARVVQALHREAPSSTVPVGSRPFSVVFYGMSLRCGKVTWFHARLHGSGLRKPPPTASAAPSPRCPWEHRAAALWDGPVLLGGGLART